MTLLETIPFRGLTLVVFMTRLRCPLKRRVGVRARISDLPSGSHRDIRISVEGGGGGWARGGLAGGWSVDVGALLPRGRRLQ